MNYTIIVLLVFVCVKGRFCLNNKISAKFSHRDLSNIKEYFINKQTKSDNGNDDNFEISGEKVQYVFERGGDNDKNSSNPYHSSWEGHWSMIPTVATFSFETGIPMSSRDLEELNEDARGKGGDGFKVKKKYQKYLLPLLLAYKLKFFTLIPVMIGGLLLLVGATGLAGFFFALFAAVMGLKGGHGGH